MPQIELVPVPLYQPLDPYRAEIDNLPITGLIERVLQVNDQVDLSADDLRTAAGNAGTLTARLAVALQSDGDLNATAVDAANHSIESHADTAAYVRMTAAERAKLALISSGATNLDLLVETSNAGDVAVSSGTVDFAESDTISWRYVAGKFYLDTAFPGVGHRYSVVPTTSDYVIYENPYGEYKANSLRVYINGIRLKPGADVYVPRSLPVPVWSAYQYAETTPSTGIFTLSAAISISDVIVIDFDYNQ